MSTAQKVKKRNGEIVDFHPQKITVAVQKAFAAMLGDSHEADAQDITRVVVDAVHDALVTIKAAPDGWKAALATALERIHGRLDRAGLAELSAYVTAARTILASF